MNVNEDRHKEIGNLETFYSKWSRKSLDDVELDIRGGEQKAQIFAEQIPAHLIGTFNRVADFGCGYGAVLSTLKNLHADKVKWAIGLDFSGNAIEIARQRYSADGIRFEKLPALNIQENKAALQEYLSEGVDVILLVDLLEHVPDCRSLVAELAPCTRYFLIKLPIESCIFDNYFLPKEYPSSFHSNGHLREFNANNVHYFVRSLGLTPVFETLYRYDMAGIFPPVPPGTSLRRRVARNIIRSIKTALSWLLPTKWYLRLVGGGGYFCVASYNSEHILSP